MVFAPIVVKLLNKYLSDYIDVSAEQLNIGVWNGNISLKDITVKENAFDSLSLPFRVIHGHFGRIEVHIPWASLYSSPCIFKLSDVYIVAVPNTEVKYDEKKEANILWEKKKKHLEMIEEAKLKAYEAKAKDDDESKKSEKSDSFFVKMAAQIVRNLQIEIVNVHVCFEDRVTADIPFQIGFTLHKLNFKTTEEIKGFKDYSQSHENAQNQNIIFKLINIECLSFYLNCRKLDLISRLGSRACDEFLKGWIARDDYIPTNLEYILAPINIIANAIVDPKPEDDHYKIPIANVRLKINEFTAKMSQNQLQMLMQLIDSIDRMKLAAPYRKWHPHVPIKKETAKKWWRFAYTAIVETEIRRKRCDWKFIKEHRKDFKVYQQMYKQKLLEKKYDTIVYDDIERRLNILSIVVARNDAEMAVAQQIKIDENIKKETRDKKKAKGWFGSWWKSNKGSDTGSDTIDSDGESTIDALKREMTPLEKNKLYNAIGYEENLPEDLPHDYAAYRLVLSLNKISAIIEDEKHIQITKISLTNVSLNMNYRPSSNGIHFTVDLSSLNIYGFNNKALLKDQSSKEENVFSLRFILNPLDADYDFGIKVKMFGFIFRYDANTIANLIKIFSPPQDISFDELQEIASDKLEEMKHKSVANLESAIAKQKQIQVEVDIEPSFVIVPQYGILIKDPKRTVLVISLGHLLISSELLPKHNRSNINSLALKYTHEQLIYKLRKLAYQSYAIKLSHVEVILSDGYMWKKDLQHLEQMSSKKLLYPLTFDLTIDRCIIDNDPHLPRLIIGGEIPEIQIDVNDGQMKKLVQLLLTLPLSPSHEKDVKTHIESEIPHNETDSNKINVPKRVKSRELISDIINLAEQQIHKEIQNVDDKQKDDKTDGIIIVYRTVKFDFLLKSVSISLFQSADEKKDASSALASASLESFDLHGEVLTDGTIWLDCSIGDLCINDTRLNRSAEGIRTLMQKTQNVEVSHKEKDCGMMTILFNQKNDERYLQITASGLRFIFALDYVLRLSDFFIKIFEGIDDESKKTTVAAVKKHSVEAMEEVKKATEESSIMTVISFNMTHSDVIFLETIETLDTPSLILGCGAAISLRQNTNFLQITGEVKKISMILCNYRQYYIKSVAKETIDAPSIEGFSTILRSCDLSCHGTIKEQRQNFDISLSDIKIIISPSMVNIVMNILSKLGASQSTHDESRCSKKMTDFSYLFRPHKSDPNVWYLDYVNSAEEVTEEYLTLSPDIIDESDCVEAYTQEVVMSVNSFNLTIESGGVDSRPLLMIDTTLKGHLNGFKKFYGSVTIIANYYNENKFYWEPLIEPCENKSKNTSKTMPKPWGFDVNVDLSERKAIKVTSDEHLDVTVTKTSLALLTSLSEQFKAAVTQPVPSRDDNLILITNYLGIDLIVYLTGDRLILKGTDKKQYTPSKTKTVTIESGKDLSLLSEDKNVEINVSLKMGDGEMNRLISLRGDDVKCFNFPKKTYPGGDNWKWIVDVQTIDAYSKLVIFKSIVQLHNLFNRTMDVFCYDDDKKLKCLGTVPPLSHSPIPMDIVYSKSPAIFIRPSDQYTIGENGVNWRQYRSGGSVHDKVIITCKEKKSHLNENRTFFIKSFCECLSIHYEETRRNNNESVLYSIVMQPIVKLRNLLPYKVSYSIDGINEGHNLNHGVDDDLSHLKLGVSVLELTVHDYLYCDWKCRKILPATGDEKEFFIWTFDSLDRRRTLDLEVSLNVEESCLVVSLFSLFWVINKTAQQLTYKLDDNSIAHPKDLNAPILLCHKQKTLFTKHKLSMMIGDSRFSNGFPIDVIGSRGNIIAKSKSEKYHLCVSVAITLSRISLTKIVTITSFYNITNSTFCDIEISEDAAQWHCIGILSQRPFWPKRAKNQVIYLRVLGFQSVSKPIPIDESESILVNVEDPNRYFHIEIDVNEYEVSIKISDYFDGAAPVMIVNCLPNLPVIYGQCDFIHRLSPQESVYFTWHDPSKDRKLMWKIGAKVSQTADLSHDDIGEINVEGNRLFWVTFLDAKQRILLFTDDFNHASHAFHAGEMTKPTINLELILKGIGLSIVDNEKNIEVLYFAITSSSILWEFRKNATKRYKPLSLKSIEMIEAAYQRVLIDNSVDSSGVISKKIIKIADGSVIDLTDVKLPQMVSPQNGNLRRLANHGIWLTSAVSEHMIQCHLKINRIQIDNQMSDCIFDIIMSPVKPPKSIASDQIPRSFFESSIVIQRQATMIRFKYTRVLIQEFLVQIDRGLIMALVSFFDDISHRKRSNEELITNDLEDALRMPMVEAVPSSRKNYYDFIHFTPLKVHVSFSLGGTSGGQFPMGLDFIISSAGVTLTEFNDVVFKLGYFERKNVLLDNSDMIGSAVDHYKSQVLRQFYVLILGLDLIGNPVALVTGLQQGVGDFFYEPFQGIIQGPEEFIEGLAIGVKSLASHVVGGAAGTLGRITGTIGEGVSALTMDEKFRRERREQLNRKEGIVGSGKSFFKGIFKGATGIVTQPFEGFRDDGFGGLMKGVGRGVIGVFAQPATGIIDFASGSLNALKRAVNVNEEAKQMRPPRHLTDDGPLEPYNRNRAQQNATK